MKIVIEIPEEKLNIIKTKMYCGIFDSDLYKAIANCTPLPTDTDLNDVEPIGLYEGKEGATVKDILELLSYGTEWRLVGASTGKILCTSRNKESTIEKYRDLPVTCQPIKADFYVGKNVPFTEYIIPMVSIWVSGK